jgi:hypothetical protein
MILNDLRLNQGTGICKIVHKGRDSSVEEEKTPQIEYDISNN